MIEFLQYLGCGLSAGLLGGYLGLGGGIIMVPYLTIITGKPITITIPVSIVAIAANSLAASTEYLRKGMVNLELALTLGLFMMIGNIIGSTINHLISPLYIQLIFAILQVYASVAMLIGKKNNNSSGLSSFNPQHLLMARFLTLIAGTIAGLLGVGGGVILVPMMFLLVGLPLSSSRGTSTFLIGFSATASAIYFLLQDRIDFEMVAPVVLGILLGGKLGGKLGTLAKPLTIRIIFFVVLAYLAFKLAMGPLKELWQ